MLDCLQNIFQRRTKRGFFCLWAGGNWKNSSISTKVLKNNPLFPAIMWWTFVNFLIQHMYIQDGSGPICWVTEWGQDTAEPLHRRDSQSFLS